MPDPTVKPTFAGPGGFAPLRIPEELTLLAAGRLIGDGSTQRPHAARRMMSAAAIHGIDLSLMWGTVDRARDGRPIRVREVCLAVPGTGRTAVLMLAGPASATRTGHEERVSSIRSACEHFRGGEVRLAQSLPEPGQGWAVEAFAEAGFVKVGDLAYLRRGMHPLPTTPGAAWPAGVSVRTVRGQGNGPSPEDRTLIIEALDLSYEDTLDCPELCGLRETSDVLESHRAAGEWSSQLWWLVLLEGKAHGCLLMNRVPEQGSIELVYIGLSKALRGRGLGRRLLEMGLERAVRTEAGHITCAVDLRNAPAHRMYGQLGFTEFGRRIAMVKPLHDCPRQG